MVEMVSDSGSACEVICPSRSCAVLFPDPSPRKNKQTNEAVSVSCRTPIADRMRLTLNVKPRLKKRIKKKLKKRMQVSASLRDMYGKRSCCGTDSAAKRKHTVDQHSSPSVLRHHLNTLSILTNSCPGICRLVMGCRRSTHL